MTLESRIAELIEGQRKQFERYEQTIQKMVQHTRLIGMHWDYVLAPDMPDIAGPTKFAPDFETLQDKIRADRQAASSDTGIPKRVSVFVPTVDWRGPIELRVSHVTYKFSERCQFVDSGVGPFFIARSIEGVVLDGGWYRVGEFASGRSFATVGMQTGEDIGGPSVGNVVINIVSNRRLEADEPAWNIFQFTPKFE